MKVKYYNNITDDFVESKNQNYKLKDNYKWINNNIFYKIVSSIVYFIFLLIGIIYTRLIKHISIKNKKVLKGFKGYYIYSNHTQVLGDAFNTISITFPQKPYIIISSSNMGIPVIGKLLPMLGGLPIPNEIHKLNTFVEVVETRSTNNPVIIYPEAHVWPYYTGIRELPLSSFHFPVDTNKPVFTATSVYTKSKFFKKPKITIYIDGPYYTNKELTRKGQIKDIHDKVYNSLVTNSKKSNYNYIEYKKRDN